MADNGKLTKVFIDGVRQELKAFKEFFLEKCKRYDKHLEESSTLNGELIKVFIDGVRQELKAFKEFFLEKCKGYDEHLKESPTFRDKITKLETRQGIIWFIIVVILVSIIRGFWWLIRK